MRLRFLYFFVIFASLFVKLVFFSVLSVFFDFQGRFLIPNGSAWGAPGHHFGVILETSLPRRVQWAPWASKSAIWDPFLWSFGLLLGPFWNAFGLFFSELFVCMRLCGCRVSKVVSYAMSHSIPLDFSTLQYNITSYDVMLRHFRSSYLRLQYIVLVCVVIDGFVMKCHGALCFILQWHAVLCYVRSCYCIFKVVSVETLMDGSVPRIPGPYPFIWFANMSHVVIICWTGLCKFTFQNVCVCGVMLHCNAGCCTNHYLNSKEVCGLAPCYLNMPCLSHVIHAITFGSDDNSSALILIFV